MGSNTDTDFDALMRKTVRCFAPSNHLEIVNPLIILFMTSQSFKSPPITSIDLKHHYT